MQHPNSVTGVSVRTAIQLAVFDAMKSDPAVFVVGEGSRVKYSLDFPRMLGDFPDRIITAPVCEGGIVAFGLGAALVGMRPIVDLTFNDLALRAMDEIVNHVSKVHFLSGGKLNARMVIKADFNRPENAQSGNRLEALFNHFPGIRVLVPSNPTDAYSMMRWALRSDDPVLFFEDRLIQAQGKIESRARNALPVGKARIVRSGTNLTVVTYGYALWLVGEALRDPAIRNKVELVDLRSLNPLDMETVLSSVSKTGRLLIVEADPLKLGIGAEISALVCEQAFESLRAPILRIGMADCLIPAALGLQQSILPSTSGIRNSIQKVLVEATRAERARDA